ncbi:Capsule biosynthesis protein CapA [Methyloligella halotolerans]|uniref:Capsule biosynthesis protein CapA n=1 Tax=Methyloligella halotolerans TaxID=1177755 RepID=A0A1E2S003_9HYPH|nr:CapA family protein [Methyloligella halotolerans]ODA67823.1 Capsule biosynthesis protein CapA [Methyloligella halotolerans]
MGLGISKALLLPLALLAVAPTAQAKIVARCTENVVAAKPVAARDTGEPETLTIVLAGDTGFNRSGQIVEEEGFRKGQLWSFEESSEDIAAEIDGDLAFANIETVITDRNDIPPDDKEQGTSFNFRSHPNGLDSLIGRGFNLFSLANNHSMDFGAAGAEETLFHFAVAHHEQPIAFAGIGADFEEATRPACLEVDGTRVGFAAAGIITGARPQHRAGEDKPGQASYRHKEDFRVIVDRLAAMEADYRILSVHYGKEGRVFADGRQIQDFRNEAALEEGIDLIVGHHPHVVQGVELAGGSVIFYGLGNFLHPGTANMARLGVCRDYGLLAKVHLVRGPSGRFEVMAIEAIPIRDTHLKPKPFEPVSAAHSRIAVLNYLGARLATARRHVASSSHRSPTVRASTARPRRMRSAARSAGFAKPGSPPAVPRTVCSTRSRKPARRSRRSRPSRSASPSTLSAGSEMGGLPAAGSPSVSSRHLPEIHASRL